MAIWLGLFSGIAFGFVIQRIGATDAHRMARSHLMLDTDIPRFMILVVALSAVGLFGLQSVGVGLTLPLPTSIVATGLAAVTFGIGWRLTKEAVAWTIKPVPRTSHRRPYPRKSSCCRR